MYGDPETGQLPLVKTNSPPDDPQQRNSQRAIFSYLFIRIHENKTLTELIPLAPNSYDVLTLSGWLCAALESKENYKGRKNVTT